MTAIEVVNLVGSIASLVLSIIAIWMAMYFYTSGKTTEKNVAESLASIKSQTDSLQKLTGRWMDRLTKYATESNPYDESFVHIVTAIKEIPTSIVRTIQLPSNQSQIDALTKETISGYIGIYYYSAVANLFAGFSLPSMEQFEQSGPSADYHRLLKETVDGSAADFKILEGILSSVTPDHLVNNPLHHLYKKASEFWRPFVRDTAEVFVSRSGSRTET